MYYECKFNAFSLFYVRLTIKNTLFKAFLTVQVIFWNKKHSPETQYRITSQEIHGNIFSHFCTRKCSSNFSSNYYTPIFKLLWKKQHLKTSTPRAIFAKNTLFSAETYRKTHFSADYSNFFALFVAEINKFMYHYDYRT